MPDPLSILTALRDELVTAGFVRKASVAGPLPPMHVEPGGGAPAPGERDAPEDDPQLVTSLFHDGDFSEDPFDAYRRRTIVAIRYRAVGTAGFKRASALDADIRAYLTAQVRNYGQGFTMGAGASAMLVMGVAIFGGFGPISRSRQGDQWLYTEGAKYVIEAQA